MCSYGLEIGPIELTGWKDFFLSQVEKFGRSGDGVYTKYIRSGGAY